MVAPSEKVIFYLEGIREALDPSQEMGTIEQLNYCIKMI
jgi:hypothetical protein